MNYSVSTMKFQRSGFSFVEVMLAIMILGLLAISAFTMISESSRGTANTYHQYLAEQIAREPLEVFRFLGCQKVLAGISGGIADYKFNEWQKIESVSAATGIERPEDATFFERKIIVTPINKDATEAILVQINVRPTRNSTVFGPGLDQLSRSTIIVSQQ